MNSKEINNRLKEKNILKKDSSNESLPFNQMEAALWLYEDTSLTYEQIANFCQIGFNTVEAIANNAIIVPRSENLIESQVTTRESINKCQENPDMDLEFTERYSYFIQDAMNRKNSRRKYIPLSKRKGKLLGVAFLVKEYPFLPNSAILKLVNTTNATIESVRDQTHWNSKNIKPRNPVELGLCTQENLDQVVLRAKAILERNTVRKNIEQEENNNEKNHNEKNHNA